jgi:ferric-dicitrate binding protein FerR (iron transport regulator)
MTLVTRMNLQDPNLESDLELITDYVTGAASVEMMQDVNRRLRTDARFYDNVAVIIQLWAVPFLKAAVSEEGARNGNAPPFDRFSREARQAQWDEWHASLGKKSIPLDDIENDSTDPMVFFPKARWRRFWKRILVVALVTIVVVVGVAAYIAFNSAAAYRTSRAESRAGKELTLTSSLWTPDIWETKAGEERLVKLDWAAITLHGASRLSVGGPAHMGAVNGEAVIEVPPTKRFVLFAAGLNLYLGAGRYRVTHAPGPFTTIVIDSGRLTLFRFLAIFRLWKPPTYVAGTTMRLEERGRVSTIRATTRDGTEIPERTRANRALLPRMESK